MKRLLLSILAAMVFSACEGEATSPVLDEDSPLENVPEGKSMVTMDIIGTKPGSLAKSLIDSVALINVTDVTGATIGTLSLTEALVALKEIELKNENEEDENLPDSLKQEIEFEGPYVVDLLNNTVEPSLDTVVIDTGNYTQIELKIDKIEGDEDDDEGQQLVSSSDPLFGNSIYIAGTYTGVTADGSVTDASFVMTFDLDEEFELSTVDPITGATDTTLGFGVDPGVMNPIIIAFRLAKWFDFTDSETNDKGVDFSNIVTSQDSSGAVIILLNEDSEDDNKEVRKVVKENIKESADYGKDQNGDGDLDSDEDDDPDGDDDDDD